MKTLEDYKNMNCFDNLQIHEICLGLKESLNVSIYAKPEFDWEQMQEIRCKLENEKTENDEQN